LETLTFGFEGEVKKSNFLIDSTRYRFYPTSEQEQLLRRTLGCVRLVYNKALHTRTEAWYERQERVDYKQTSGMLTEWKKQEELQFQGRS